MATAPADAWDYWNAMQSVRAQGAALAKAAPSALRTCSTKIKGAGIAYYDLCAIPYLTIGPSATVAAGVATCFALDYFKWTQSYLAAALKNQPHSTTSSGLARVFWALDVWAHVQYALMALNIPYGEPTYRFARMRRDYTTATPVNGKLPPLAQFEGHLEAFRDTAAWKSPKPKAYRDGPFMESIVGWCDMPPNSTAPSTVWSMLVQAVLPWTSDWGSHWLPSKGNKDRAELAGADAVYQYGLMQWRMWAVQDYDNFKRTDNAQWPQGMGRRYNCGTLTDFAKNISYNQSWTPEINVNDLGVAEPNFAWCYINDLPAQIGEVMSANYETLLRQWWQFYIDLEGPRFTPAGALDMAQVQPVTQTDYADLDAGLSAQAVARAQAALADPRLSCAKDDQTCLQAAELGMKTRAYSGGPLAGLNNMMQAGMAFVLKTFGITAATSGKIPYFVMGPPFARSYEAAGYSTAPDGSSVDVWTKITGSMANIDKVLSIDMLSPPRHFGTLAKPRDPTCHVTADTMIEVCAPKLTAALPMPSSALGPVKPPPPPSVQTDCSRKFGVWLTQNPSYAKQLRPSDVAKYTEFCMAVSYGTMTQAQADAAWHAYIGKPAWLRAFVHGFMTSGNPLRS